MSIFVFRKCVTCGRVRARRLRHGSKGNPRWYDESQSSYDLRKHCSRRCMWKSIRANPRPRKENASHSAGHKYGRQTCPAGPCVRCGNQKAVVHRKDRNWNNNAPENLERICYSCHTKEHRGGKVCSFPDCSRKHEGKGFCVKHYDQFYRTGRTWEIRLRTPKQKHDERVP